MTARLKRAVAGIALVTLLFFRAAETVVGARLLKSMERESSGYATERGFKRMFLSTTPFLARAIQLYERKGFKRTSEGPDNLFGTPLFTMEKLVEQKE